MYSLFLSSNFIFIPLTHPSSFSSHPSPSLPTPTSSAPVLLLFLFYLPLFLLMLIFFSNCFLNSPPLSPLLLLLFFRYLNVFQPLQLGGVKETSPLQRYRSFTGCIRNLVVDSQVTPPRMCVFTSQRSLAFPPCVLLLN